MKELQDNEEELTRSELFEFKKECLFEELKWRLEGSRYRLTHKWQLRLLFAVFSASFLGISLSSKGFRDFEIPFWQQTVGTAIFFFSFYIYDANLGSLTLSTLQLIKSISKILQELSVRLG